MLEPITPLTEATTAREQAEAALRLSEEKFAMAFRCSPDALIISSIPDSRITEINERASAISGYAREELLGRTTVEIGLWADPGVRERYVATVRRDGRVVNFEAVFRSKSGALRTCLMSTEILQLPAGPHFLSVLHDITERKEIEMHASRWQQLFEAAEFSLALTSTADNTFIDVNPACARERGYTREELVGKPVLTIYAPEAIPAISEWLKTIDQSGHLAFDSVHLRKDGTRFPVLVEATAIRDEQGRQISRVAYAIDITERKRAEAEVLRHVAELQARNEQLDRMNRLTMGRETRVIELKQEVNELCRAAGQPARYASEAAEHLALARAASLPPDAKATPLPKL